MTVKDPSAVVEEAAGSPRVGAGVVVGLSDGLSAVSEDGSAGGSLKRQLNIKTCRKIFEEIKTRSLEAVKQNPNQEELHRGKSRSFATAVPRGNSVTTARLRAAQ